MREVFSVPEVSCGHCKGSIEGALEPLPGVQEATVHIQDKQLDVRWDPAATTRDEVLAAVRNAGYEVIT